MFRLRIVTFAAWVVSFVEIASAQESPTPIPSPTVEKFPSRSISPLESITPSPSTEQTPLPSPARSVRISFVPPPMEGTISLGIYDQSGKLVRILHQNAQLNDFTIGADALATRWDGKDDSTQDLPAGRYHARGYLIGPLRLEDLGEAFSPATETDANPMVKVRLVRNPLRKDQRPLVEVAIGFNGNGSYLKTKDGLPLFRVNETLNLTRVWIAPKNENTVDVWQGNGATVHQFRVSNLDQMMAFDCGDFELK